VRVGGEGLMGERQLAGGQIGQQAADMRCGQPVQRGGVAGAGGQGGGQWLEGGVDGPGAVVEQLGQLPGDGAGAAEPAAGGQVAFVAAVQAGEVAADPGAVGADRNI
jgi:hypothetical protein